MYNLYFVEFEGIVIGEPDYYITSHLEEFLDFLYHLFDEEVIIYRCLTKEVKL